MAHGPTAMTISRLHRGAVASLAALALAATAAAPASATAPSSAKPAFALSPVGSAGALLVHGRPGRVRRGAVRVRNVTGHRVTVRLQAADIQNASNGNADYVTTRLSQTGQWLDLAATTVHLAPRASQRVAFTVRIPAGTRGASHYAGIVAVNAAELAAAAARKTAKGRTFSFRRINRQALPLTVRLPGPLTRNLALRSAKLTVAPAGAGLVLGLLPGGSQLIQRARIKLRVQRDARTIFTYDSTLGQLFPGAKLDYRIPWKGRPTEGSYRVLGVIHPHAAAAVNIDETIQFSPAKAAQLKDETTPTPPPPGMPIWVWVALAAAAALLIALSLTVYKLTRRPATPLA